MRIALISDIHANFVALETVLAEIDKQRVDQIVCLGDVAANGPQPHEVIERLRNLGCPIVRGNTDEWFLVPQTYDPDPEKERRLMAMLEWGAKQLSTADVDYLHALPFTREIALDDGKMLLCFHGSPQSNIDLIFATTSDDELVRMLGDNRATVMAGGHTHTQMLRRFHDVLVINPGSVGMPFVRGTTPKQDHRPPWSEYALVDSHGDHLAIELCRVPIDVNAVVRAARESGMPHLDFWAGEWMNHGT